MRIELRYKTLLYSSMPEKKPTKEEIVAHVFEYFDDLDFIEKLNDLTYSRKVQLKARANK